MTHLLHIETSGKNCSVALSIDDRIVAQRCVTSEQFIHAEQLHLLINEVQHKSGIAWKDISAVAVSKGPGSYTGLRIGVSAAKGLCYAIECPLIAIGTTDILAQHASLSNERNAIIIPMIDARRLEVYAAEFDASGNRVTEDEAIILDAFYFEKFQLKNMILIGDGATKCSPLVGENVEIRETLPDAAMMIDLAKKRFNQKQFENLAYFEPHYLKAYVPGISKRSVL